MLPWIFWSFQKYEDLRILHSNLDTLSVNQDWSVEL